MCLNGHGVGQKKRQKIIRASGVFLMSTLMRWLNR